MEIKPITTPMLSKILPSAAVCFEQIGPLSGRLLPQELTLLGPNTVSKRHLEFAAGRSCARAALELIGIPQGPILQGKQREPLWPHGIIGSITHCEGYCAATVAFAHDCLSIGIDAEPNQPLPTEVLELIAVSSEMEWLATMKEELTCWGRLLFSIKESIYKAWFPLTNCWLDFDQAIVDIDYATNTYKASLLHPDSSLPSMISGEYLATKDLLLTTAWWPAVTPSGAKARNELAVKAV